MESPTRAAPTLSRSRAGTLSWQQRPSSRDFGSKSPGSTSPTRSSHLRNASTASDENQLSRAQVAASLGSKDPSWFRQTSDRGLLGSPAYKKPEEWSDSQVDLGMGRRLPGMSRESTAEPEKTEVAEETPSSPRTASTVGESNPSNRYSSVASVSPATGLGSPVPLSDAQKLDPPPTEPSVDDPMPPSPTQRRMSPERSRSSSPTKGLGGFVQSAMMRRSDSVSKRWSAQIPQRSSRGNSLVGNRNSVAAPSLKGSVSDLTSSTSASRLNQETSPLPAQRPGSSHSDATVHPPEPTEKPTTPVRNNDPLRSEGSPARPASYGHARSTSSVTAESQGTDGPSSPFTSRTMDPKRWSPTKASWLESALNRPETPRHQKQPSQQPAWARERQSRSSVDMGRMNSFKEVTPVGLMRTPPPGGHFKKPSVSGTPSVFGSPNASKAKETLAESALPATDVEPAPAKAEPVEEEIKVPSPLVPEGGPQETQTEIETISGPEPKQKPEPAKIPELQPTRKEPPPALSSNPNFSLPSREPISPKPKPQSPVIDFRANLRKREVAKDTGSNEEPEFRNVFGKLKKTETRNYVAPDELKSNILRGKAALNMTGGPQKTERVDELKDSLLKQKEAMKAGGGSIRRNTMEEKEAPAAAVPEAIAKRAFMTKTSSIKRTSDEQSPAAFKDLGSAQKSPDQLPESPSAVTEEVEKEVPQNSPPIASEPLAVNVDSQPNPGEEENLEDTVEATKPDMEAERKLSNESASSVRGLPSARRAAANAASATPNFAAKEKLAGRINPALAGFLSRGPPVAAEGRKAKPATAVTGESSPASSSAPLTHMTKARARGPKRRLPKGDAASAVSSVQDTKEIGAISSPEVKRSQMTLEPVVSSDTHSERLSKENLVLDAANAQTESPVTKQLPAVKVALNSGQQQELRSPSPISPSSQNGPSTLANRDDENAPRDSESPDGARPSSRPPVPPKPISSPSPSPVTPSPKPQWSQQARYTSNSPSPLRTSYRENRMNSLATPPPKPIPGVMLADSCSRNKSLPSPPGSFEPSGITLDKPADPNQLSRNMSAPSLVAQAAEAREVIATFFKSFPNPRDRIDIDPQLMLTSQMDAAKIRPIKRQIWELTGDGKRQELPINQEYVLYEGSMYLCVHQFEGQNGASSEVYLWCGDDVLEAALDDAQLFARKVARENGCKLEVVRQGKEPMQFIQALGGIIITRRGSSSRHTSSALYMLCGRKHMGQMAFDEVDYSLRNLCSGFPFVISAPFGKLYLWKGKGSGPEETGAARLISMDLGLTGEFEEVDEGQEPESFFDVFAGSNETNPLMTSNFWQIKPKYDHYRTRLLRVDHQLGQPPRFWGMRRPGSGSPVVRPNDCVQEIEPFCHRDLTERDVYVLDTFFEIYV